VLKTIVTIILTSIVSSAFSCLFYNKKKYPNFSNWWNAEGIVIFILSWLLIGGLIYFL